MLSRFFCAVAITWSALTLPLCAGNLIINGDFSAGTGSSGYVGFTSDYTYGQLSDMTHGNIWVDTTPPNAPFSYPDWVNFSAPSGSGNMLIVNGSSTPGDRVWAQSAGVSSNTSYDFSLYAASVDTFTAVPADLQLDINGSVIGSTGPLPNAGGTWTQYSFDWNSGNATTADLSLVDLTTQFAFNDVAIDDLTLTSSSTTTTPEPSSWVLFVLAGVVLLSIGVGRRVSA
jgi:hypothetical protein